MYLRQYDEFMALDVISIFVSRISLVISHISLIVLHYQIVCPRDPLVYTILYNISNVVALSSLIIILSKAVSFFSSYFHYHNASQACPSQEITGTNGYTKECVPLSIYSATAFHRFDIQFQQENTLTNPETIR